MELSFLLKRFQFFIKTIIDFKFQFIKYNNKKKIYKFKYNNNKNKLSLTFIFDFDSIIIGNE